MPRPPNYYAAGGYDRAAKLRKDDYWLATRLDHPGSRIVPVWRNQNLVTKADGGAPARAAFLMRDQIAGDPAARSVPRPDRRRVFFRPRSVRDREPA